MRGQDLRGLLLALGKHVCLQYIFLWLLVSSDSAADDTTSVMVLQSTYNGSINMVTAVPTEVVVSCRAASGFGLNKVGGDRGSLENHIAGIGVSDIRAFGYV